MAGALWAAHASLELDAQGVVLSASPRFKAIAVPEPEGASFRDLLRSDERVRFDALWSELLNGTTQASILRVQRDRERRACWLSMSFTEIPGSPSARRFLALGTDVTGTQRDADDALSQLRALRDSKAVIEFDLSGHIRSANRNFLDAVGYELDEIRGQHHRIFVRPEERESEEYREFWRRLGAGESFSAQYQRIRKDGRPIWIEATYSAVKTTEGRPYKIVKFCSDITALVEAFVALEQAAIDIRGASRKIASSSDQVDSSVAQTQSDVDAVVRSADDVVGRTGSVADGLEGLRGSVERVSSHANEAASIARQGVETAKNSDAQMRRLGVSSEEIGSILQTIASIAKQTNLLALNATIEAARAGEAGKGFAVVATEVKELAKETSRATEDIEAKIDAIRSGTSAAMEATVRIVEIIESIDRAQTSIHEAVEEQKSTVGGIRGALEEAKESVSSIVERSRSAANRAASTGALATEASSVATDLANLAEDLRRLADAADPRRMNGPEATLPGEGFDATAESEDALFFEPRARAEAARLRP